jgi:hypothetical protein
VYYKLVFLATGHGLLFVLFGVPLRHPFPCCSASAGLAGDRRANNFGTSRPKSRSRIHERTVSLRFLGIILRVLKLEVSVYNGYNYKPVSTHNLLGVRGGGVSRIRYRDDCEIARRKTLKSFIPITSKNLASGKKSRNSPTLIHQKS